MIESYQLEITRKRQAARYFWLIVFLCAMVLYFFFQGYYPDVRLGVKRILSDSGSETSSGVSDLIRSFGIINVKVIPEDSTILLGNGSYNNNEKRMSDYGTYTIDISRERYLSTELSFDIDREKPFFIEKISLIPQAKYEILTGVLDHISVGPENYIIKIEDTYIHSGSNMREQISYSGSLKSLGDNYIQTSTGILIWGNNKLERVSRDISNFVNTCPRIDYRSTIFSCSDTKSLVTKGGLYMTGILSIRDTLIERSGSISEIRDDRVKQTWKTKNISSLSNIHLLGNTIYTSSGGILREYEDRPSEPIITGLDTIVSATLINDDIIIIGSIDNKAHIAIQRMGDPQDRLKTILFPDRLLYEKMKFHNVDGNIWIETPTGILFIYRGSTQLNWLVEGDILSYSDRYIVYKKDEKIWSAVWKNPEK